MKKILEMLLGAMSVCCLIMSFTACSDDDDLEVDFYLTTAVENETAESVKEFQYGDKATEFRYGDNIGFVLRLRNTGNDDVNLGSDLNIIGSDIFTVYKENGEVVGKPWREIGETSEMPTPLYAGNYRQWQAVWRGKNTRAAVLFPNEDNEALAIGSYYCRFVVRLPDRNVVCKQHFSVIP